MKTAFEILAPFKLAFMKDAPDASRRVSVLPDKSALANIEFRTLAPERSTSRNVADVKSVPVIVAPVIVAPDKSALVMVAPEMVELVKFAFLRLAELKFVFVIVVVVRDAPDKSADVMLAPEMVELFKFVFLRLAELKFVFVILVLARDAPFRLTFAKLVELVKVAPWSVFAAAVTSMVAVILDGASYNVPCACDATITAEPGDNNVTRPDVGCIVNTVEVGS